MKIKDIRQHPKYAEYMKTKNWIVEENDGVFYYIRRILFASAMKVQRPEKIDFKFIEKLQKKHKVLQTSIEPNTFKEADKLIDESFAVGFPMTNSLTIMVNLKKSEKKIYENMSKDTRYSIRKSEKVKLKEEKDLDKFRKYWRSNVNFKRHVLNAKDMENLRTVFGRDSRFLVAEDGISGGIFLVAGDVGYYWYGFVGEEGRKRLSQYKVVWEGMKWAKKRGAKYFDMEGIFDERFPIPAWRGFTKFKKGFGGKAVKFPGSYQVTRLPF